MFDNKTMLLLVLGLVIFLLVKSNKKNESDNEAQVEVKTESETETTKTESANTESNNTESANTESAKTDVSDIVETFSNRSSERVDSDHSDYPFHKKEYLDDSKCDVDFEPAEVVTESEKEPEVVETFSEKPHVNRIHIDGSNVQEAYKSTGLLPNGCDPNLIPNNRKANLNKDELLPGEATKDWFDQIIEVDENNLLKAGPVEFFGTNTVSSSLRNASYDIRGDQGMHNPKKVVSPWNNTTIGQDTNLRNSVLSNKCHTSEPGVQCN